MGGGEAGEEGVGLTRGEKGGILGRIFGYGYPDIDIWRRMFTQTTEYALRAAVWLAENHGGAQTTQQIARATKVPAGYLAKVLQALGRAGLLRGSRGLHGGFELSRPPEEVRLIDILNVVEPIRRIRTCPLEIKRHKKKLCPLHARLDEALALIEASFEQTTLKDLVGTPSHRPLCESELVKVGGVR